MDYVKFSNLENYLFDEVGPGFAETGKIEPADFFAILMWKSNRAKTRVRDKLSAAAGGFDVAVARIAKALHASRDAKERLRVLMEDWGLRLPMATAILTVLCPDDFTIYDTRVCGQLGAFESLGNRRFSDRLWDEYVEFVNAVRAEAPDGLSLRDADRFLWGRSVYEGVKRYIQSS